MMNGYKTTEIVGKRSRNEKMRQRTNGYTRDGQRKTSPQKAPEFPLRILVPADMVGAIIGRQGTTIRQISQETRARIDVHRKNNFRTLEEAITIYGNPENSSNACKSILEVMQKEMDSNKKGKVVLKILGHNNLIGRVIGKEGNTIKRMMTETETRITVSAVNDTNNFLFERIITIKGDIDNMVSAEAQISSKLRQSYEADLKTLTPYNAFVPPGHPMGSYGRNGYITSPPPYGPPPYGSQAYGSTSYGSPPPYASPPRYSSPPPYQNTPDSAPEITFVYIPSNSAGALIGPKGQHIRSIIRYSGASIKIEPQEQDKEEQLSKERKVTVVGSPESQWNAQYLIFNTIRDGKFTPEYDDTRLTVEILVDNSFTGRIIGKGGQTVRELQRFSGAQVKVAEKTSERQNEIAVHIIGTFYSVQSAQRRIRAILKRSKTRGHSAPGSPTRQQQQ